jgi:hypothetical protein
MHKYRFIYPNQQKTREISKKAEENFYLSFLELSANFKLFTANCLNWLNNIELLYQNSIVTNGANVSPGRIMNLNCKH